MTQVTDYTIQSGVEMSMELLKTTLENIFAAIGSANRGSDPPDNPFEGMLWWDSSDSPTEYLKRYTVTSGWLSLISVNTTSGAVAFVGVDYVLKSILTTTGDLFYASAASTPVRLAIGNEGDSLMVSSGGVPYWNNLGDPLTYKGTIDCSGNPNYPAADEGDMYFVSAAGKIGGASGTDVYVGYRIICKEDDTAAGTEAEVGDDWDVVGVTTLSGITLISLAEGFTVTGGTTPHTITVDETKSLSDKADKASNLSDMANAATAFTNIKQDATTTVTGVLYCSHGTSTFQSTTGRTITLDPVAPNTDYQVLIEQQAESGFIGEITIKTKATNSFVVENSGSDVTTAFGWTLINV